MFRVLEIRRKQRRWLGGFAWSSDGELLSAVDHRGHLSVFQVSTGAEVGSCYVGYGVRAISWTPQSHVLHVVSEEGLATYSVSQLEGIVPHQQYSWLQDQARGLISWSSSGQLIAADRGSHELAVFFVENRVSRIVAVPDGRVNAIAWASSDECLAVAHGDHLDIVALRNAPAARTLIDGQTVTRARWCDGDRCLLAVNSAGAGAAWWPAERGRSWSFPVPSGIVDLDASARSSHAWTLAWDGTVAEWDIASGTCLGTIQTPLRPEGIFQCIACSPRANTAASFGGDGNASIAVWSTTEVVEQYQSSAQRETPGGPGLRLPAERLNERYVLGQLLGVGGMGAVYEAEDLLEKRRVAIKLLLPDHSQNGPMLARFERESRAASAIDTEHIARVLDSGRDTKTGAPFIAMEYLHGEDLERLLGRAGALPPAVALRIIAQACVGMHNAHRIGIVHRDIKPANIWLARLDGSPAITVKLLDFGLAKIKRPYDGEAHLSNLTNTGMLLGTPLYMSPEQASGAKDIDHRTDIWSLGVVLHRILTGRTPHTHIENLGQLIAALVTAPTRSVRELAPWLSPEIAAIVDTALQRDPANRFPTAAAMREAIAAVLGGDTGLSEAMLAPPEGQGPAGASGEAGATTMSVRRTRSGRPDDG